MSSDEPSAEQLTKFLFVRQPAPIRERLVRQRGIERALGLSSRFVVNIPQFGSLDASLLFQTVREVFKTHNTQHVTCIDGTVLYVTLEDGAVVIRQSADVKSVPKAILQELMLLSPNRAQRDKALKAIVTGLGVAVPDSVHRLALEIAKAPVTDNLLTPLFGEISDGVTATHARIEQAIKRGQSNVTEVVPRSLAYYLNFCGPLPNGRATDEYLSVVLSDFRKELIKRGVTGGLEIALLGGLSVEITPAPWVTDMQKDTLWEAIEKIDPWRDPFSLLNTLDIALDYLEDDRFHDFARRAAEKLTSPVFECGNKNDGFELLPTFAMLVLDQLNDCPETNTCPPFWKRMCAWMHGAVLSRIAQPYNVNIEELRKWADKCCSPKAAFTRLRDLRIEPMFRATKMAKATLVAEIIGRLDLLTQAKPQAAESIGLPALTRLAQQEIAKQDPYGWFSQGPLEGHRSPRAKKMVLQADDVAQSLEMIRDVPIPQMWFGLAKMSELRDLTDEVIRAAGKRTSEATRRGLRNPDVSMEALSYAAIVACAHRDVDLANTVAEATTVLLHSSKDEGDVSAALQIVLMAAAAISSDKDWNTWVEDKLAQLAYATSFGPSLDKMRSLLQEARSIVPLPDLVVERAEAIAGAG